MFLLADGRCGDFFPTRTNPPLKWLPCAEQCLSLPNCTGLVLHLGTCTPYTCGSSSINSTVQTHPIKSNSRRAFYKLNKDSSPTTSSPTTSSPTTATFPPTFLTTPSPTPVSVESRCSSDTASIESFDEVHANLALCETFAVSPGAMWIKYPADECGPEACVRHCLRDSNCRYALYDTFTKRCTKTTSAQLMDLESTKGQPLTMRMWWRKGYEDLVPRYYGGRCAPLTYGDCASDPQCQPNTGRQGVNDEKLGGSAGFYCGRVSC